MTLSPIPSTLDIMTLREVREANESGAGVAVLDRALGCVLWANTGGHALLGLAADTAATWPRVLSANLPAARQIRSMSRVIDARGASRLLVRTGTAIGAKPVVADLRRVRSGDADYVLLAIEVIRPRIESGADLAMRLLGESRLDDASVYGPSGRLAGLGEEAGDTAVERAIAAFLASDEALRRIETPGGITMLARIAAALVLVRREPGEAQDPVSPDAPEAAAAGTPSEGRTPGLFSVRRRALAPRHAPTNMTALVERWHSRQAAPAETTGGQTATASGTVAEDGGGMIAETAFEGQHSGQASEPLDVDATEVVSESRLAEASAAPAGEPQVAGDDRGAEEAMRAPGDEAVVELPQDLRDATTGEAVSATDETVADKPRPVRSLWGAPEAAPVSEAASPASLPDAAPAMSHRTDDQAGSGDEEAGAAAGPIDDVAADDGMTAPALADHLAEAATLSDTEIDVPAAPSPAEPDGPSDDGFPVPNDVTWTGDHGTSQPEEKESAVILPDLPPEDAEALEEIPATDAEEPGERPGLPEAAAAASIEASDADPIGEHPSLSTAESVSRPAAEISADATKRLDGGGSDDISEIAADIHGPVGTAPGTEAVEPSELPATDEAGRSPAARARGPVDDDVEDVEAREAIEAALGVARARSLPTQSFLTRDSVSRAPDELIGELGPMEEAVVPLPSRTGDDDTGAATIAEGDTVFIGSDDVSVDDADEPLGNGDGGASEETPSPASTPSDAVDLITAGPIGQAVAADDLSGTPDEAFRPSFATSPVRFVWQIDRDGRFSALSPEFGAAVGAKAADVIGRSFRDVSQVFAFDVDGEIARLLDRRDTWSGRSILWPVENSDRKAPVDLAALPVYAADRSFDGFRGFGVLRMNEAVADADAIGLLLGGGDAAPLDDPSPVEIPDMEKPQAFVPEDMAEPVQANRPILRTFAGDFPLTPFGRRQELPKGDAPAQVSGSAALDPLPEGADVDDAPKVIRLEERRRPKDGMLSQAEEAAFRAIGMKLGTQGQAESPGAPLLADAPAIDDAAAPDDGPNAAAFADDAGAGIGSDTSEAESPAVTAPDEAPRETGEDDGAASAPEEAVTDKADTIDRHAPDAEAPLPVIVAGEEPAADTSFAVDEESFEVDRAESEERTGYEPPSAGIPDETPDAGAAPETGTAASGEDLDDNPESPSTEELDSIFGPLPLPILVQAQQTLVYANREFSDLTGYADITALNAAGGLDRLFAEPNEDGDRGAGEISIRRSNGQMSDARVHMQRVTLSDRSYLLMSFAPPAREIAAATAPAAAALVSVPVSETSAAPYASGSGDAPGDEADLREQIEELQAVLDTATDGIVLLAPPGHIRAMNGSAQALFGAGQSEHQGKHLSTLFAHESQKATHDYLEMLRDNGLAGILNDGREVIGRVAQGGFIPLFITVGRLTGERGWCVVIRDMAHWKRIEEDLVNARRQAEAASLHKSRFLANISHELRTPLNAIIGFADVMASECFGPIGNERYLEYLGDIKRSGHHVLDLVNDLLDISKIEAGKLDLSFEAVALNEVVSEVVSLMQPQANRERVIVRSNLPSSVPPVVADRRTIRQIALNLVANAIRFTPAGGQIIVSTTYTAEGDVVLRFRDSGIGMTEREIEIALTPFQQVHAPSVTRGEGTGLGLPLTKAMVEANRAVFAIHSTPGEGTLVEISFPSQRVLAD